MHVMQLVRVYLLVYILSFIKRKIHTGPYPVSRVDVPTQWFDFQLLHTSTVCNVSRCISWCKIQEWSKSSSCSIRNFHIAFQHFHTIGLIYYVSSWYQFIVNNSLLLPKWSLQHSFNSSFGLTKHFWVWKISSFPLCISWICWRVMLVDQWLSLMMTHSMISSLSKKYDKFQLFFASAHLGISFAPTFLI